MAGNTEILIKRSLTTGIPSSLNQGELAYSYQSNTIFIGTPDGLGTVNVGGQFYTSQVDDATDQAYNNTLVRRDGSGNASFTTIYGALGTNSGVDAGTYGDQTHIPVVTVAANGLVTNVTTSQISTTLSIDSDNGSNTVSLIDDTIKYFGAEGITTSINRDTNGVANVVFEVDTTVVRSNTALSVQTIDGAIQINGNLSVLGTQTIVDTQTVKVTDPLLYLAANNTTSDVVDIGIAGTYNDGAQKATGIFRNAGNKDYYVFDNYDKDVTSSNDINVADSSFHIANLHANVISTLATIGHADIASANVTNNLYVLGDSQLSSLTVFNNTTLVGQANTTHDLGIGGNLYTTGSATVNTSLTVTGTTTLNGQANATSDFGVSGNTYLSGDLVVTGTASFGSINLGSGDLQVDAITANSATFTTALEVASGGTGRSSFTTNGIIFGNDTNGLLVTAAAGYADVSESHQILTVTSSGVPVWTNTLDGGSF